MSDPGSNNLIINHCASNLTINHCAPLIRGLRSILTTNDRSCNFGLTLETHHKSISASLNKVVQSDLNWSKVWRSGLGRFNLVLVSWPKCDQHVIANVTTRIKFAWQLQFSIYTGRQILAQMDHLQPFVIKIFNLKWKANPYYPRSLRLGFSNWAMTLVLGLRKSRTCTCGWRGYHKCQNF